MNKKLLTALIALCAVLVLLLAGLPIFSRLYYHRSQAATVFAWQFRKSAYTTEQDFIAYLGEKRAENAEAYEVPEDTELSCDLYRSEHKGMVYYIVNPQDNPDTLIVYYAGGTYIDQPRAVHFEFLDRLAEETGATVLIPLYPKLPESTAADAYTALIPFTEEVVNTTECGKVIYMGDSAGGGMALSLAMQLKDAGIPGPRELILLSPWVDVSMTNPDIAEYEKKDNALDRRMLTELGLLWANELGQKSPVVSPVYGDLSDLCPVTLFVGTGELLYPDIMRLSDLLDSADTDVTAIVAEGMFHVWPLYVGYGIPEAESGFMNICAAVNGEDAVAESMLMIN